MRRAASHFVLGPNREPILGCAAVVFVHERAAFTLQPLTDQGERHMKAKILKFSLAAVVAVAFTLTGFARDEQTTIYTFKGKTDGGQPSSGLIADAAGNLYGTTIAGGSCTLTQKGCGTVFELSPSSSGTWTETVLHTFAGGVDGWYAATGLVFDSSGNLYGATSGGGGSTACLNGCGIIYELSPSSTGAWTETILYTFPTQGPPAGDLITDTAGNLYGALGRGGANALGSVFELSPGSSGWTFTTLFSFSATTGNLPTSGVISDAAGNLYGTAYEGGDITSNYGCGSIGGCGVVYRLTNTSTGWRYAQLYVFHGPNGSGPSGGLVFDSGGNLFGTTVHGGTPTCCGFGVVYRLSPAAEGLWKETLLHSFTNTTDGDSPNASLIIDSASTLFGTSNSYAFRVSPATSGGWQFEVLTALSPGANEFATQPLVRDAAGNLFGTSYVGGNTSCKDGCGSVYELSPITAN